MGENNWVNTRILALSVALPLPLSYTEISSTHMIQSHNMKCINHSPLTPECDLDLENYVLCFWTWIDILTVQHFYKVFWKSIHSTLIESLVCLNSHSMCTWTRAGQHIQTHMDNSISYSSYREGAQVAKWLSASAFGPGGLGFEPRWSRLLSSRDVLEQGRFS